jgi:hypothetical protein
MQTNTVDFINLPAFARAVADHWKETLNGPAAGKRVFNLDEAAEYCGLTRDSFKRRSSAIDFERFASTGAGASTIRPGRADRPRQKADRPGGPPHEDEVQGQPCKGQGNLFLRLRSPHWYNSYWNGWHQVRESSGTADHGEAVKTLQRKLERLPSGNRPEPNEFGYLRFCSC